MVSFNFDFYKPKTIEEAVQTYYNLSDKGKRVVYYAGGTEINNRAEINQLFFDAAIDIKEIPECNVMEFRNNNLVIGAAVTLDKICNSPLFPFLSEVCQRSATQSARKKITIGGNICGNRPYREATLPLLLCHGSAVIAYKGGIKTVPFIEAYNSEMNLEPGELLVQVLVDKKNIQPKYEAAEKRLG